MRLEAFLEQAWNRYAEITPDAPRIHRLLSARGQRIVNDHVAFRTFNIPRIDRLSLGVLFEEWGYRKSPVDLDFPDKKLKASYWIHPSADLPKIFISELLLEHFPKDLQNWVHSTVQPFMSNLERFDPKHFLRPLWSPVRWEDYQKFYPISEYAAWTAAFGIQVNHFTVLVNALKTIPSLEELNQLLTRDGFILNTAGGTIKGTPAELLEQTSTQANRITWKFADGVSQSIMSCYYEFARRYPEAGSEHLFQGFIPKSADKIFESNFEKK